MGFNLGRGASHAHWVPMAARSYLGHVAEGRSFRAMAREAGVHPSTILRQVRRIEERRDDPLIDAALTALSQQAAQGTPLTYPAPDIANPAIAQNEREAEQILRKLAEPDTILALADEMEKAVVIRERADGSTARTAVTERSTAEAMALRGWLEAIEAIGRVRRYRISGAGRTALVRLLAADLGRPSGLAEAQTPFSAAQRRSASDRDTGTDHRGAQPRVFAAESPIAVLARRRDKGGVPFLSAALVAAAARLREDFELAQMGPKLPQNWDWQTIASGASAEPEEETGAFGTGPRAARSRVAAVLADLGPGLGDVVLRCCCYLEGLESAEKRLGWSSRSGKIVLRIALQRLHRHYEARGGMHSVLIG